MSCVGKIDILTRCGASVFGRETAERIADGRDDDHRGTQMYGLSLLSVECYQCTKRVFAKIMIPKDNFLEGYHRNDVFSLEARPKPLARSAHLGHITFPHDHIPQSRLLIISVHFSVSRPRLTSAIKHQCITASGR